MENKAKESVKNFMEAWKKGDHKEMLKQSNKTFRVGNTFQKLRALLPDPIKSYEIGEVKKESEVMYDVSVKVKIGNNEKQLTVRTISESHPFKTSLDGDFGVNPHSVNKSLKES